MAKVLGVDILGAIAALGAASPAAEILVDDADVDASDVADLALADLARDEEQREPEDITQLATRALAEVAAPALRAVPEEMPFFGERVLRSELPGVADAAWTKFVLALKTAQSGAVSASNALGMFELKPKRLADLGIVRNIKPRRSDAGRMAWAGEFVPPLTRKMFLGTPSVQYKIFSESMKRYVGALRDGSIPRPDGGRPDGMTLSGILAILHRCGPSGLRTWNDEANRFPQTVELFERANGIF